jgi:hypothetical protein
MMNWRTKLLLVVTVVVAVAALVVASVALWRAETSSEVIREVQPEATPYITVCERLREEIMTTARWPVGIPEGGPLAHLNEPPSLYRQLGCLEIP